MLDIELVPTEDKPITGIRKRLILTGLQKVNPDYGKLLSFFMNKDKERFYDNKQMLIDLMEDIIERAFIEGQRTGTKHIEYIKGEENGREKAKEVYPDNEFTIKD